MSVTIVSFEAQFKRALYDKLADNLHDAIVLYDAELKRTIGIQGPPRSKPGSPPHMDTGYLHDQSLSYAVDPSLLVAEESSDAPYAAELELMMDREFFVPTLVAQSDAMAREICKS